MYQLSMQIFLLDHLVQLGLILIAVMLYSAQQAEQLGTSNFFMAQIE